jgi:hypothetical protein
MRPFTTAQLRRSCIEFTNAQPSPSQKTVHNVLSEFVSYLDAQEPPPEPDAADVLYRQGKEAYLKTRDPFRGLSKAARKVAEQAQKTSPTDWRATLYLWLERGDVFAMPKVGEATVKELCRFVTAPADEEVKQ